MVNKSYRGNKIPKQTCVKSSCPQCPFNNKPEQIKRFKNQPNRDLWHIIMSHGLDLKIKYGYKQSKGFHMTRTHH